MPEVRQCSLRSYHLLLVNDIYHTHTHTHTFYLHRSGQYLQSISFHDVDLKMLSEQSSIIALRNTLYYLKRGWEELFNQVYLSPLESMILRLSDGKRKCLRLELHRKGQRYQKQLSPYSSPAEAALPRTYKFQGQTCLGQWVGAHTLLKRYGRNFLSHNPQTQHN